MNLLRLFDNALSKVVSVALVTLFLLMLGLAAMQVLLRYFFGTGVLWADPAARNLVIWVGFLGAIIATKERQHFEIDVLTRFLRPAFRIWIRRLTNLCCAVICYLLGQAAISVVELDMGSKTFLDIPSVALEVIVPVGFFLMAVRFIMAIFMDTGAAVGASPLEYVKEPE
ncbi:MAG TPA: TRAP transporter small permease [Bacteroidota bacterium]|jgi:TRAP-type C4-dicarboxylate transport system permease small subunit|nr:TRAP transporter small permease [Bacteroidota bacterium]